MRWTPLLSLLAAALVAAPGPLSAQQTQRLTQAEVERIIAQATTRALEISPRAIIAVVDRDGFVLGVWSVSGIQPDSFPTDFNDHQGPSYGAAIREAGTASFLSSNQNAFTSRVAQFIIQQHFPPGVVNRPPGPLVGVAFSNLAFSDVNRFKGYRDETGNGFKLVGNAVVPRDLTNAADVALKAGDIPINTRLSGRCSSAPLYKNGELVGGIGVFPRPEPERLFEPFELELLNQPAGPVVEENVALAGQVGFEPAPSITGNNVTNDGIRFPYVLGSPGVPNFRPFAGLPGAAVNFAQPIVLPGGAVVPTNPAPYTYTPREAPPLFPHLRETLGNVTGEVRYPIRADPNPGLIRGQARLSAADVRQIIASAADRARTTRAAIRLPIGVPMQVWITVVGNPNQDGAPPPILGIFRTPDAPHFSFDVALQKARTALFFSSDRVGQSSRTVGFLAQDNYPPGLDALPPGPYGPASRLNGFPSLNGLQLQFTFPFTLPVTQRFGGNLGFYEPIPIYTPPFLVPLIPVGNAQNLPNGITIFPGGFPLYRNGVLIGAIGISGDGVDQDDLVGISGSVPFAPAPAQRADAFIFGGARLPFAKTPRNGDIFY